MTNDGRYRSAKRNTRMARLETAHGVTLVELLVVIGIMVAVMAIAIPVVRLTSNDNRVALATQAVRSFLMEAIAAADRQGNSYVIFERNVNNPNFCNRLYRGRPRPAYRGEDETAYAIKAPSEIVVVPGVPSGNPPTMPGGMPFEVFYLFNADANKIQTYQYLSFRDRPEKYLVFQSFPMPAVVGQMGPVAKVYCRLDPQTPLSSVEGPRSGLQPIQPGPEFAPPAGPVADWTVAATTVPERAGGGPIRFWPADRVLYPPTPDVAEVSDIPNLSVGTPGQFLSRLLPFEVTQPPMLDELNYLDLPSGMAISLAASGFGDIDVFNFNGGDFLNSPALTQLAFVQNAGDDIRAFGAPALADLVDAELRNPASPTFIGLSDNPIRAAYYPRIEFEGGGRVSRAFVMSPRFTAAGSVVFGPNNARIARTGPLHPLFPLFLLIGEDNFQQRSLLPVTAPVLPGDHWIMLGAQMSTPKIVKAQPGMNLDLAHVAVAESVSER